MSISITGFEALERDYVKDMIEMAGAAYTAFFTRDNDVIICKEAKGDKFRKSQDWKVPAVSIHWLNDVLFGDKDVSKSLGDVAYKKFGQDKDPLGIRSSLVTDLMAAWRQTIVITQEVYYEYKQRVQAQAPGLKRSLDLDTRILTPERKRMKLDPRSLFAPNMKVAYDLMKTNLLYNLFICNFRSNLRPRILMTPSSSTHRVQPPPRERKFQRQKVKKIWK